MAKINHADAVRQALKDLCAEAPSPTEILFRTWFQAKDVAARAGCSESTARKHLEACRAYRGYRSTRFSGGTYGYRYDEPRG